MGRNKNVSNQFSLSSITEVNVIILHDAVWIKHLWFAPVLCFIPGKAQKKTFRLWFLNFPILLACAENRELIVDHCFLKSSIHYNMFPYPEEKNNCRRMAAPFCRGINDGWSDPREALLLDAPLPQKHSLPSST